MSAHHRRAFRHAVEVPCQVVRARDFRLVAQRTIDLSHEGMQVVADLPVLTGEPLVVSFRVPRSEAWIDADAFVARVVHGLRSGERGRSLGIAFDRLDADARRLLFQKLSGAPPASCAPRATRVRRADTHAAHP